MAIYNLSNPFHRETFNARTARLLDKNAVVELTERKPRRSLRQNAYLHVALAYFSSRSGYTISEVKEWFFKEECNAELFVREKVDNLTGKKRKYLRSSTELDTAEMTMAIERFRNWAAQTADIYIASPDDPVSVMQMEIEASNTKLYS